MRENVLCRDIHSMPWSNRTKHKISMQWLLFLCTTLQRRPTRSYRRVYPSSGDRCCCAIQCACNTLKMSTNRNCMQLNRHVQRCRPRLPCVLDALQIGRRRWPAPMRSATVDVQLLPPERWPDNAATHSPNDNRSVWSRQINGSVWMWAHTAVDTNHANRNRPTVCPRNHFERFVAMLSYEGRPDFQEWPVWNERRVKFQIDSIEMVWDEGWRRKTIWKVVQSLVDLHRARNVINWLKFEQ